MFKKKENGFSLVELSVAAAVATALAVVAVTVVSGTATSISEKGDLAAAAESCTISEALQSGGDTIQGCALSTGAASAGDNTNLEIAPSIVLDAVSNTVESTTAIMSWSAPVDGGAVESYDLFLNNEFLETVAPDTNGYSLINLSPDTAYVFGIEAKNSTGSSERVEISFTTSEAAPSIVVDLYPSSISSDSVTLVWSAPFTGNVENYDLFLGGEYLTQVAGNVTSYTINNLSPESSYTFGVQAINSSGASSLVNSTFTTEAIPFNPFSGSSVSGTPLTSAVSSVTLAYNNSLANGSGTGLLVSSTWSTSTPYIIILQNRSCGACNLYSYAYVNNIGAEHRVNNGFYGGATNYNAVIKGQTQQYAVSHLYAPDYPSSTHLLSAWAGDIVALLDGPVTNSSSKVYQMIF